MTLTVTDLFAGAGGSSSGMMQVPGVFVRMAANHWKTACEIHNANHPDTDHAAVDLHREDPRYFPRTDILWASPECTKWSQANGTELPAIEEGLFEDPLSDEAKTRSRLLMFDVLRFIEHHRYRLVFVENVVDIATQAKYALAWQVWRQQLRALGYRFRVISVNSMHAQAEGNPAPQSRDRIYIAAWPENELEPDFQRALRPRAYCPRCDEVVEAQQAFKPGKTVGRYRQAYVYVHAACGEVVEPGYLPAAAAIDWSDLGAPIGDRLTEKTRLRIAAGIARYWGPVHIEAMGNQYDAADPKHPQHGDPNAYYRAWSIDEVIRTLHTQETKGLAVPAGGTWNDAALPLSQPMRTVTTRDTTGVVAPPFVAELRGGSSDARPVNHPAATFCANGNHHALVTPYYGNATTGRPPTDPIGTLTTRDRYALVTRHNNNRGDQSSLTTPAAEYMRTLTTKGIQSILHAPGGGRPKITPADIEAALELVPECHFRMFKHPEVAAGMAFAPDYNWQPPDRAKPVSQRDLVKATGNAVCPPNARDLMAVGVESLS